jgi:hypothetical protein
MAEDVQWWLRFLYGFGLGVMGEWFYLLLLVLLIVLAWVAISSVRRLIKKL